MNDEHQRNYGVRKIYQVFKKERRNFIRSSQKIVFINDRSMKYVPPSIDYGIS